ncbi:MAG: MBL fold metallo-hydrolase [Actinomycetota bacterium]|nr:MBL fold metallo-hydrolase [Actinomycetota bacterium]
MLTRTAVLAMLVTVLGSAGSYPAPGRACSSYLVEDQGYRLLVDCGNGSVANLLQRVRADSIAAVVITHRHVDHMADLVGLYHLLRFHGGRKERLPVYAPSAVLEVMEALLPGDDALHDVCRFETVHAGHRLSLGPLDVSLFAADHPVETVAMRVESAGGRLAYSADSGPTPELARCAAGADLFLCESTWAVPIAGRPAHLHLDAREAGEIAAHAGVGSLVLTHVAYPGTGARAVREARATFGGTIIEACDLHDHVVGSLPPPRAFPRD